MITAIFPLEDTLRSVKIQGFIHEVRAFAVLIDIINDKKISGVRGFGIN